MDRIQKGIVAVFFRTVLNNFIIIHLNNY
jgi:hypothetical protein